LRAAIIAMKALLMKFEAKGTQRVEDLRVGQQNDLASIAARA
jgi:hypothetical protein